MERRTATLSQLGFQLQNEAGYDALSSGWIPVEPANTQNWNQRMRSTTEPETDTNRHWSRLQTWLSLLETSHENKRDETKDYGTLNLESPVHTIASIRLDWEKWILRVATYAKSLPIDICTYVENLNSWLQHCLLHKATNKLHLLYKRTIYRDAQFLEPAKSTGYNIVHFAENTLCSHFRK